MINIVHLLSGGMDSVTMLHEMVADKCNVFALSFNYNQRHKKELSYARSHAQKLSVKIREIEMIDLGGLKNGEWIVPNRNAIFCNIAINIAIKAKADSVTIGCNAEDQSMFPDCSLSFIKSINETTLKAGSNIKIKAPYLNLTKKQIAKKARSFGILKNEFLWCYKGKPDGCGKCPACEKMEAAW